MAASKDQRHRIANWIESRTAQLSEEINPEKARRQAVAEMEAAMHDRRIQQKYPR